MSLPQFSQVAPQQAGGHLASDPLPAVSPADGLAGRHSPGSLQRTDGKAVRPAGPKLLRGGAGHFDLCVRQTRWLALTLDFPVRNALIAPHRAASGF